MKTEEEIRRQLEKTYEHRLALRIERKTKQSCRNCAYGTYCEYNLGDFGNIGKWSCSIGKSCGKDCGFSCVNTPKQIEQEMLDEISNPAVCGAKEPKIGVLLWILHGSSKVGIEKAIGEGSDSFACGKVDDEEEQENKRKDCLEKKDSKNGFVKWLMGVFNG